jgi:putative DNA primase/helicase
MGHKQIIPYSDRDHGRLARAWIQSTSVGGHPTVRHWRSEWHVFRDGAYSKRHDDEMKAEVRTFIQDRFATQRVRDRDGHIRNVTENMVMNVLAAIRAAVLVPYDVEQPVWLTNDGKTDTSVPTDELGWLAMSNGLVRVSEVMKGTATVKPHTPRWFSPNVLPYAYNPDAKCPKWERFVGVALDGDHERIAVLQEWTGLLTVPVMRFQKFVLLQGPPQTGKGTYQRVITAFIGKRNISNLPVEEFGNRFQLDATIGKLLVMSPEAKTIPPHAVGTLKSFTGEDDLETDRKFKSKVQFRPTAKLMIVTNERLPMTDKSGALARRLLPMPFYSVIPEGEKNVRLTEELLRELEGIFIWAMAGLKRLLDKQAFSPSQVIREEVEEYDHTSNPTKEFIQSRLERGMDHLETQAIYEAYELDALSAGITPESEGEFVRQLKALFPWSRRKKIGRLTGRPWGYTGLRWKGSVPDVPDVPVDVSAEVLNGDVVEN